METLTSLMCLYVLMRSTLSLRSGASVGPRKWVGMRACMARMSVDEVGLDERCNIWRLCVCMVANKNGGVVMQSNQNGQDVCWCAGAVLAHTPTTDNRHAPGARHRDGRRVSVLRRPNGRTAAHGAGETCSFRGPEQTTPTRLLGPKREST